VTTLCLSIYRVNAHSVQTVGGEASLFCLMFVLGGDESNRQL